VFSPLSDASATFMSGRTSKDSMPGEVSIASIIFIMEHRQKLED